MLKIIITVSKISFLVFAFFSSSCSTCLASHDIEKPTIFAPRVATNDTLHFWKDPEGSIWFEEKRWKSPLPEQSELDFDDCCALLCPSAGTSNIEIYYGGGKDVRIHGYTTAQNFISIKSQDTHFGVTAEGTAMYALFKTPYIVIYDPSNDTRPAVIIQRRENVTFMGILGHINLADPICVFQSGFRVINAVIAHYENPATMK